MYLVFDTETTGLGREARITQLAMMLLDENLEELDRYSSYIYPDGWYVPRFITEFNGITTQMCRQQGKPINQVLDKFEYFCKNTQVLVAHNISFDLRMLGYECSRTDRADITHDLQHFCTLRNFRAFNPCLASYKLGELYRIHTGTVLDNAHNAIADVEATAKLLKILKSDNEFFENSLDPSKPEIDVSDDNRQPAPGPRALYDKGMAHYNGQTDTVQDYKQAWEWLNKAAELGHFISQYRLGVMCEKGQGVSINDSKAIEYYTASASKGYEPAQKALGLLQANIEKRASAA